MRSRSRAKSIDLRQAKKKLIINLWVLLVCLLAFGWGLRKLSVLMLSKTSLAPQYSTAAPLLYAAVDYSDPYDSSDDDDDDDTVVV